MRPNTHHSRKIVSSNNQITLGILSIAGSVIALLSIERRGYAAPLIPFPRQHRLCDEVEASESASESEARVLCDRITSFGTSLIKKAMASQHCGCRFLGTDAAILIKTESLRDSPIRSATSSRMQRTTGIVRALGVIQCKDQLRHAAYGQTKPCF